MFAIWLTIVGITVAIAFVLIPLTAASQRENMRRIESLMERHRENLRSEDPAVVADSKERWRRMCRACQMASPRNAVLFYELERWGEKS